LDAIEERRKIDAALFAGFQKGAAFIGRMGSLPQNTTRAQVMEMTMEHHCDRLPFEDQFQAFQNARHARGQTWRAEQRHFLQIALELAAEFREAAAEDDVYPLHPPAPGELVAHLEAVQAMLREQIIRHRNGRELIRRLAENPVRQPMTGSTLPVGPWMERSRNVHDTAILCRCEQILLAQHPELADLVQSTYESLLEFRICRAAEPWQEPNADTDVMTLEQLQEEHARANAERDGQTELWEDRQLELLEAAIGQARQLARAAA
jgi:hypothetical protein